MKLRKPEPALVRLLFFVLCFVGVVALLVFAGRILLPLIAGLAVAYLLDPAVTWFERKGRSRAFGTVIISIAVLLATAAFLFVVVPAIGEQITQLRHRLPQYERQVEARVVPWLGRIRNAYPDQFDLVQSKAAETIREKWPEMLRSTVGWLGGIFSSVLGFFLFLLDLIFVPVFAFYLLVDFPKLKRGIRSLIPLPYREISLARLGEVDDAVSSFLRGQLTIALILAAINGIGLTALGVPLGLLLGIVAGLANMIPYMALVVGLAPAMLLCWVESQSLPRLIGVVALFSAAQLLEGTILSPRILSKSVNLHPVWVLLAIIVGGRLFGLLGMVLAVPAAAAIHVFVRHWLESYRGSSFYRGAAAAGESPPAGGEPGS